MGCAPAPGSPGSAAAHRRLRRRGGGAAPGRRPPCRRAGRRAGRGVDDRAQRRHRTGCRTNRRRRRPRPPARAPSTSTTDPDDEGPPVVLEGDGIGAFHFGAALDEVIAGLTLRWGPPDSDSGWIAPATLPTATARGRVVRGVEWRGFTVLFSDGATPLGHAGRRHFFTWVYQVDGPARRPAADPGGNRPPLQTAAGVSVGATVGDSRRPTARGAGAVRRSRRGPPVRGPDLRRAACSARCTGLDPGGIVRSIVSGGGCGE